MNTENKDEVVQLYLDDIIPNRFQPREVFDERALKELAVSIREHGVIQPIIVRSVNGKYEIIAGERRYKASALAGLTKIPAIIRDLDDKESSKVALLENLQRKNLNPIEEARTFHKILEIDEMTQEELAKTMGKSQSAVANKLRLLTLPDDIQDALLKEEISERHARALLNVPDTEVQKKLLEKVVSTKMSVRALEEEIRTLYPKEKEASEIPIEENAIASTESFLDEKPLVPHVKEIEEETSNYGKVVIAPPKEEKEEEIDMANRFINFGDSGESNNELSTIDRQDIIEQERAQTIQKQGEPIQPVQNPVGTGVQQPVQQQAQKQGQSSAALDNLLDINQPVVPAEQEKTTTDYFDLKEIPNIKLPEEIIETKKTGLESEVKQGNPLPSIVTDKKPETTYTPQIAQQKIKNLIDDLKAHGVSINADEMDFPKSYQFIIKIDKPGE